MYIGQVQTHLNRCCTTWWRFSVKATWGQGLKAQAKSSIVFRAWARPCMNTLSLWLCEWNGYCCNAVHYMAMFLSLWWWRQAAQTFCFEIFSRVHWRQFILWCQKREEQSHYKVIGGPKQTGAASLLNIRLHPWHCLFIQSDRCRLPFLFTFHPRLVLPTFP